MSEIKSNVFNKTSFGKFYTYMFMVYQLLKIMNCTL